MKRLVSHIKLSRLPLSAVKMSAIGVRSGGSKKEYIKGHVTDGATSITLKINNVDTSVPVGADGYFKWVKPDALIVTSLNELLRNRINISDVEININASCSMESMFYMNNLPNNSVLKYVKIKGLKCNDGYAIFTNCTSLESVEGLYFEQSCTKAGFCFKGCKKITEIDFEGNTNGITNAESFARDCDLLETLKIPNINVISTTVSQLFTLVPALKNVIAGKIEKSITFKDSPLLTEQSVVNLFNAVQADGITLTFHPTVGAIIDAQMDAEEGAIFDAYMNSDYEFEYIY